MMHRRNWTWLPLIGALLIAACGRDEPGADAPAVRAAATATAPSAVAAAAVASNPRRATTFAELVVDGDYELVVPAPPQSGSDAPIAVAEAFSYACSHCAHFEPELSAWVAELPADVAFEAVPMPLNDVWTEFARAYYASVDLGLVTRTHAALFKAMHEQGARIDSVDALVQWFADAGDIENATFSNAMQTPGTDARIDGARARAQRWGVASTPTLLIDDRYKVQGFDDTEGGFARTLAVADLLLAEVRRSRTPPT